MALQELTFDYFLAKSKEKQDITFTIPHPNMIETDEIKNSLSRKNPLLFLEYNNRIYANVHQSILWKADILGIKNNLPHSFEINFPALKSKWVEWVKNVKMAKWGDHKQKTTVRMISPKI